MQAPRANREKQAAPDRSCRLAGLARHAVPHAPPMCAMHVLMALGASSMRMPMTPAQGTCLQAGSKRFISHMARSASWDWADARRGAAAFAAVHAAQTASFWQSEPSPQGILPN
jgi:hypothetical protein